MTEPLEPVGSRWLSRRQAAAEERRAQLAFVALLWLAIGLLWR